MAWLNNKFPYFIEFPWARNKCFFLFLFMRYEMHKEKPYAKKTSKKNKQTHTNRMNDVDIRIIVIINKRLIEVYAVESNHTTKELFTADNSHAQTFNKMLWKCLCFTCSWVKKKRPDYNLQILVPYRIKIAYIFESVRKCAFHFRTEWKVYIIYWISCEIIVIVIQHTEWIESMAWIVEVIPIDWGPSQNVPFHSMKLYYTE